MRAAVLTAYGPPEVLELRDLPPPTCGPGQLRVDVYAAGINPVDYKIRDGCQRAAIRLKLPAVLGMDVSGVVAEVGAGVTGFAVGDEVFSSPSHKVMGCYAEQVVIPADQVAKKPKNIPHSEAAGVPLAGLTAWACLDGLVRPGDRVLIHAGSGGVGTLAIQLAKHQGAWVATTCSAKNAQLVSGLGADQPIDYRSQDFREALDAPVALVLDALGGDTRARSWGTLARGGRMRSICSGMPEHVARYGPNLGLLRTVVGVIGLSLQGAVKGKPAASVLRKPDGAALGRIAALIEAGVVRPVVDRVLPLEDVVEAHRYLETGRARGKVILRVRDDQV